ncbi:hypothetical protein, partial [Legionella donaldsonii]|uniref:hypothetical protein n=1 Tax=Legionella donaldsonii TaxID=45060 RepID=UPI00399D1501
FISPAIDHEVALPWELAANQLTFLHRGQKSERNTLVNPGCKQPGYASLFNRWLNVGFLIVPLLIEGKVRGMVHYIRTNKNYLG